MKMEDIDSVEEWKKFTWKIWQNKMQYVMNGYTTHYAEKIYLKREKEAKQSCRYS